MWRFRVESKMEEKVMALTVTPGLKPDIIDYAVQRGYKGIVLECYGAGGVNTGRDNLLPAIRRASRPEYVWSVSPSAFLMELTCPFIPWGSSPPKQGSNQAVP